MQNVECKVQNRAAATAFANSAFCTLKSSFDCPVLESHQPLRFCKPPPELLGQRDNRVKLRRPTKDQNLCRADLGSPADSSIRGLNRSRSPRCNVCARESRAERG